MHHHSIFQLHQDRMISFVLALLITLLGSATAALAIEGKQPNIILIITDDKNEGHGMAARFFHILSAFP